MSQKARADDSTAVQKEAGPIGGPALALDAEVLEESTVVVVLVQGRGHWMEVAIGRGESVGSLKRRIQRLDTTDPERMLLICARKLLDDDSAPFAAPFSHLSNDGAVDAVFLIRKPIAAAANGSGSVQTKDAKQPCSGGEDTDHDDDRDQEYSLPCWKRGVRVLSSGRRVRERNRQKCSSKTAMTIYVTPLDAMQARTFALTDIEPADTIEVIKAFVENESAIPMDRMRLIANGKQLEDHRTAAHYALQNETTLFLVGRMRGS